jgi:hypothetical protein
MRGAIELNIAQNSPELFSDGKRVDAGHRTAAARKVRDAKRSSGPQGSFVEVTV